jgi:hypothetical protein
MGAGLGIDQDRAYLRREIAEGELVVLRIAEVDDRKQR